MSAKAGLKSIYNHIKFKEKISTYNKSAPICAPTIYYDSF